MPDKFKYEVFLSHNGKDKPAVEYIARLLRDEYNQKAWLDKWNLVPGDAWQEALEAALDECQTFAVFLGPSGIGPWENEEMRSAIEERVQDKNRRVIPVLLPGAPDNRDLKLPRFLRRATWVDFRSGLDDKEALYLLYCGITGQQPGDRGSAVSPKTPTTAD
jgi:TIR domain-containing protein